MTLKETIEALRDAGVDSPEYDARELFKKFGGCTGIINLTTSSDEQILHDAIDRRISREPLQYILGSVGFYREEYIVSPDCLIPRSDTEILVDYAVKNIPRGESFADLCSGSGCIGISTLANTHNTVCVSVDVSEKALAITEKNAKLNKVYDRIKTARIDLLSDSAKLDGEFYAILSNPPYVANDVYETLGSEIFHEPKIAFVGGDDGMIFYEKLIPLALSHLKNDGFIAFEIGYDQANKITLLASENCCSCEIIKDYSGNDRVAVLKRINNTQAL